MTAEEVDAFLHGPAHDERRHDRPRWAIPTSWRCGTGSSAMPRRSGRSRKSQKVVEPPARSADHLPGGGAATAMRSCAACELVGTGTIIDRHRGHHRDRVEHVAAALGGPTARALDARSSKRRRASGSACASTSSAWSRGITASSRVGTERARDRRRCGRAARAARRRRRARLGMGGRARTAPGGDCRRERRGLAGVRTPDGRRPRRPHPSIAVEDRRVLAFIGRNHLYERRDPCARSPMPCARPLRRDARRSSLTNACGSMVDADAAGPDRAR